MVQWDVRDQWNGLEVAGWLSCHNWLIFGKVVNKSLRHLHDIESFNKVKRGGVKSGKRTFKRHLPSDNFLHDAFL